MCFFASERSQITWAITDYTDKSGIILIDKKNPTKIEIVEVCVRGLVVKGGSSKIFRNMSSKATNNNKYQQISTNIHNNGLWVGLHWLGDKPVSQSGRSGAGL